MFWERATCLHLDILINDFIDPAQGGIRQLVRVHV
jgi:hypothetical protein